MKSDMFVYCCRLCSYMHTAIYIGLYFFVSGTYFEAWRSCTINLWLLCLIYGEECYMALLPNSNDLSECLHAMRNGTGCGTGTAFCWWTKCVDVGVRGEVGTSEFLLLDASLIVTCGGTRWRSGWGTALQTGRSRVRFPMSLGFLIDIILPVPLWSWGRLSL
jgi:hypothetical protein